MEYIYVGLEKDPDKLIKSLNEIITSFKLLIEVDETEQQGIIKIQAPSHDILDAAKQNISAVITQHIIENYEKKIINRILNSNYFYFNSGERKEILKNATRRINNCENNIADNLFILKRRDIIQTELIEYLMTSNQIILEGFVNFRLREYTRELEEIVEKAVDEYLTEKEYRQFINLLKYFVEIQEPKINTVHVVVEQDKYVLLDTYKKEITDECVEDFINEMNDGNINYDDLLVSSLITIAPKRLYIHKSGSIKNKELTETIKRVFGPKIVFCNGCELCEQKSASLNVAVGKK